MNADTIDKPRGRGPLFWIGMIAASTGVIVALGATGAVEDQVLLLLLLLVPVGLIAPLYLSATRRAARHAGACGQGMAQARYMRRVGLFTGLYVLAIAALTYVDKAGAVEGALRLALALLPGLAVIGVLWAIGRLIVEEQDEFQRMLVIRQTLVATALALGAASIWGFLEAADIVPHLDAYWVVIAWFAGLAVGAIANRIQYGSWGAI